MNNQQDLPSAETLDDAAPALVRERPSQYVELSVSVAKFQSEIEAFRAHSDDFYKRGQVLVGAEFPVARVLMCAPQLRPNAAVFAVEFDYSNYDVEPPSVTIVEPFTNRVYRMEELPMPPLLRLVRQPFTPPPGMVFPEGVVPPPIIETQQPLLQAEAGAIPFLCIAGVREYHEHPAHTADRWEAHRESGAGRLVRLLEVISRYGIEPLSGYNVQLQPAITGFGLNAVPE